MSLQFWKPPAFKPFKMPIRSASYVFFKEKSEISAIHHISGMYGVFRQSLADDKFVKETWNSAKNRGRDGVHLDDYNLINRTLLKCQDNPVLMVAADNLDEHNAFIEDCLFGKHKWLELGAILLEDANLRAEEGQSPLVTPITSSNDSTVFDNPTVITTEHISSDLAYANLKPNTLYITDKSLVARWTSAYWSDKTASTVLDIVLPKDVPAKCSRLKAVELPFEELEHLILVKKNNVSISLDIPFSQSIWAMILAQIRANNGLFPNSPFTKQVFDPFDL